MMKNKWLYLFLAFIAAGLLYPAIYVLNLQDIYGGIFLKIPTFLLYAILVGFFIYPFVKGVQYLKAGQRAIGTILIVFGIVAPVVSGAFGILVVEFLGKGVKPEENS